MAALRRHTSCRPDDPHLRSLVAELTAASPDFHRLWSHHDIQEPHHGTTRLHHPLVGELTLSYESLHLPSDPDQTLTIHHAAPSSPAEEDLRLLMSFHAQLTVNARSTASVSS